MAFFIGSSQAVTQKTFIPGDYTTSTVSVPSTTGGIEVVAAGVAGQARYLTLKVVGSSEVFISFGTDPTTTDHAFSMPAKSSLIDYVHGSQVIKAISASGTVDVQVSIAPVLAVEVA